MKKVSAFLSTAAFFTVFGLPWLWVCAWDVKDWANDARDMYRKLSEDCQ